MSRSLKKGPYVDADILKKISRGKARDNTVIKTWARDCVIAPEMVGFTFGVHNGKEHVKVLATEEMVGHKLGEFAQTRKFVKHGGKIQKDLEMAEAEKQKESGAKEEAGKEE
ncbi:MAG: 30S ribosomal protein S19 [Patescibacteria group bacterium]|nr:30S ribosomal protein S19 [Patescibacteria group bacterium]